MNAEQQTHLVESYVASSRFILDKENTLRRADESTWASDALYQVSSSEPMLALRLCVRIAETDGSEQMLERVANGPRVEVLKRTHASQFEEIRRAASEAEALRELLSCAWEDNELSESAWAVIHEYSAE